jgi:hypothetical protein
MYVQSRCLDNASVQRLTDRDLVYTIIEKNKHVHTLACMYISVNVYTCMYTVCPVHGTYK